MVIYYLSERRQVPAAAVIVDLGTVELESEHWRLPVTLYVFVDPAKNPDFHALNWLYENKKNTANQLNSYRSSSSKIKFSLPNDSLQQPRSSAHCRILL